MILLYFPILLFLCLLAKEIELKVLYCVKFIFIRHRFSDNLPLKACYSSFEFFSSIAFWKICIAAFGSILVFSTFQAGQLK